MGARADAAAAESLKKKGKNLVFRWLRQQNNIEQNFVPSIAEFFTDLLAKSKVQFHKLFQKTYGIIYERNSDVFIDFFRDLEDYYRHGEVDLEQALQKFFGQLYQRMFIVFNSQHNFDYP